MLEKLLKRLFKDKPIKLNYLVDTEEQELADLLAKTTKKFLLSKGHNNNQPLAIKVTIDALPTINEYPYTYLDTDAIELKLQRALINKPKSSYGTDFNKGVQKALSIIKAHK